MSVLFVRYFYYFINFKIPGVGAELQRTVLSPESCRNILYTFYYIYIYIYMYIYGPILLKTHLRCDTRPCESVKKIVGVNIESFRTTLLLCHEVDFT
jgi:hypothetical protein